MLLSPEKWMTIVGNLTLGLQKIETTGLIKYWCHYYRGQGSRGSLLPRGTLRGRTHTNCIYSKRVLYWECYRCVIRLQWTDWEMPHLWRYTCSSITFFFCVHTKMYVSILWGRPAQLVVNAPLAVMKGWCSVMCMAFRKVYIYLQCWQLQLIINKQV